MPYWEGFSVVDCEKKDAGFDDLDPAGPSDFISATGESLVGHTHCRGFSPVWIRLWIIKLLLVRKERAQNSHM